MKFEIGGDNCIELIKTEFHRIDIEQEEDQSIIAQYCVGILDVYSHNLSVEDAARLLSSHQEHNIKYEERFINTIASLFENNGHEVLVYFPEIYEDVDLIQVRQLDCIELINLEYQIIKIKCMNDLDKVIKMSTRELIFSSFFFMKIKTVVLGNYELSFPVYCKDIETLATIEVIAVNNGLFIRK